MTGTLSRFVSIVCLASTSLACGGGSGGAEDSMVCDKNGPTGDSEETLQVGGAARTFSAHVPSAAASKKVALVFAFHGDGGNGESLRQYLKLEEQTGDEAIVIYPNANGRFDFDKQENNLDLAFFDAILAKYQASHCIGKVFATGFSSGGYFTNHLGCHRGSKLAAIAAHGSGGPYAAPYKDGDLQCPDKPTASLVVHGLEDGTVAPSEGDKSIKQWSRTLSCSDKTSPSEPSPCVSYEGCQKPLEVCKVPGLGHSIWDKGIEKTWSFFKTQR